MDTKMQNETDAPETGTGKAVGIQSVVTQHEPDAELLERGLGRPINVGDYVTRGSWDIQYVESMNGTFETADMIRAVCIVPPDSDWCKPGEYEDNLRIRYHHINRHYLKFAKAEHEKLKKLFPDGWIK